MTKIVVAGGEITDPASLLLHTPQTLRDTLNLDVRKNHNVTGLDADKKTVQVDTPTGPDTISYDALVLSPGASAIRPDLPGLDSPRINTLRTVADAHAVHDLATSGVRKAVVLGAGFIGLEAAEALHLQGLDVSIIELAPHVLPALELEVAHHITSELTRMGLAVHDGVSASAVEVSDTSDVVVLSDGTRLDADLIVLSVGVRPNTAPFESAGLECERGAIVVSEHGRTNLPSVWAVGDATLSVDAVTGIRRPGPLAGPANRAGRLVADDILGANPRPIPAPLDTAIVRVGDLTAAITGIDKRIDVLATALRAHMTVEDLIDLDLSYFPPYGSAKDPVNMAGLKAQNVLRGTTRLWQSRNLEEVRETALILDVRSAAFGRPVRILCQSGMRSYLAHRVLAGNDFDSATLSGGMISPRTHLGANAESLLATPVSAH